MAAASRKQTKTWIFSSISALVSYHWLCGAMATRRGCSSIRQGYKRARITVKQLTNNAPTFWWLLQQRSRTIGLPLAVALIISAGLSGGIPGWVLVTPGFFLCPSQAAPVVGVSVQNLTQAPQTIPAGTVFRVEFSVPIISYPTQEYGPYPGTIGSFSGNVLTVTFSAPRTLANGDEVEFFVGTSIMGLSNGTPITANVSVTPLSVLGLPPSGLTIAISIVDQLSCQVSPALAQTIDDLAGTCPSTTAMQKINSDLSLTFTADPTIGTLVCRAVDGSADLTLLQERTYQALLMMQQLPLGTPLPWTNSQLYDWFVSAVRGITYTPSASLGEGAGGYCCSPAGVINVIPHNPAVYASPSDYLAGTVVLFAHEARHAEGYPHTCGSGVFSGTMDTTLSQLGAWSVQYYLYNWMAFYTGTYFIPHSGDLTTYRSFNWRGAQGALTEICNLEQGLVVVPSHIDFQSILVGDSGVPQTMTLTLAQGFAAHIGSISTTGANAADFQITQNNCAAFLPPDCPVRIGFHPTAVGPRQAQLSILDTASGVTTIATLSGTGIAATNVPTITSVVNAASFLQVPLAPNTWFSVFGANLGTIESAKDISTTVLGGATITVCGIPVALNYNNGQGQINALMPPSAALAGDTNCPVVAMVGSNSSAPVSISIGQQSLGVFQFVSGGLLLPVATHADYSLIGPTGAALMPAQGGETIIIWCTGWNQGVPNPIVAIGGIPATVVYYGVSGTSAGLCQINVVVPSALPAGASNLVVGSLPPYSLWLK